MTTRLTDAEVEQRLRRTFDAVAATVTEAGAPAPAAPRKKRRRRIALGAGALALPLAAAAGAYLHTGPEYVDSIPESSIVVRGEVDGDSYLLVESRRTDSCGEPVDGVELVEEDENILGSEWNTSLYRYGEYGDDECTFTTDRYLADPALFDASGAQVGDSLVWVWSVHPDVTAVRVTSGDFHEDLDVHRVDGAGYAILEFPKDMDSYTSELLIDDRLVPGSSQTRDVPVVG